MNNKLSTESRCLLMCATPLQVLIAEKIIKLNPGKTFDLIFTRYSYDNKVKFDYYFDRLSEKCSKSLNWILYPGLKNFLYYRYTLNKLGFNMSYDELYLSNIERKHFQYIISQYPKAIVYTYDDGMGNINPLSKFNLDIKPSFTKRVIWKVLGIKYYMKDIRKKTKLHYTIYDGIPNIIQDTKYIKLFDRVSNSSLAKPTKILKIYLGQPLFDINPKFTHEFILKTIDDLNIDYYFPHPREEQVVEGDFKVLESELIFEDYIVNLLKENPNTHVEIYSFISSVLLNLAQIDNIESYYIYDSYLQDNFHQFYTIAKENFGIESKNFSCQKY